MNGELGRYLSTLGMCVGLAVSRKSKAKKIDRACCQRMGGARARGTRLTARRMGLFVGDVRNSDTLRCSLGGLSRKQDGVPWCVCGAFERTDPARWPRPAAVDYEDRLIVTAFRSGWSHMSPVQHGAP